MTRITFSTYFSTYPRALALAVFILLACIHTWPLAADPAHASRIDNGDAMLNTWAVAWVGHQLPRDPLNLFDANIFYPEPLTLAYSEAMIVQGVLAVADPGARAVRRCSPTTSC